MDTMTAKVLTLDLGHLTREQVQYLHDLKAEAIKGWAEKELNRLRMEETQ